MNPRHSNRYDGLSQAFHWLTAVAVLAAFILGPEGFGRMMRQGVDPATRLGIVWHESLGVLVFVLTLLRLLWLAARPTPPRIEMPAWQRVLARLVQGLLWLMLLALPISAVLTLGSEGHPMTLLGGLRIAQWPWITGSALGGLADWGEVHEFLGEAIMWLAGLHALAAIGHHVVQKDGVLRSMLP